MDQQTAIGTQSLVSDRRCTSQPMPGPGIHRNSGGGGVGGARGLFPKPDPPVLGAWGCAHQIDPPTHTCRSSYLQCAVPPRMGKGAAPTGSNHLPAPVGGGGCPFFDVPMHRHQKYSRKLPRGCGRLLVDCCYWGCSRRPSVSPPTAVGYPPTAVGYAPTLVGYPPTAVGHPPTAVGYPPTAVGYPPTTVGYPPTAVGYPPTAVGYPPTAVGYPPTAVGYAPTLVGYPPTAVGYPPTAVNYPSPCSPLQPLPHPSFKQRPLPFAPPNPQHHEPEHTAPLAEPGHC